MTDRPDLLSAPGPALGALHSVALPPERAARAAAPLPENSAVRARPGWGLLWLALLALMIMAGALALGHWRDSLGRLLVPDAPLTQQLSRAQTALDQGELSRDDGQGARELFQAVLAVDPDHPGARKGLTDVRSAALAQADSFLQQGDRDRAKRALDLAIALSAPAASVTPLLQRLQHFDNPPIDSEHALEAANELILQARFEQALVLFERVLEQEPDNTLALDGRRRILAEWLRDADTLVAAGQLEQAQQHVATVQQHDPSHLDLPPVKARLGEAEATRDRSRQAQRADAERAMVVGDLAQAWTLYQALLATAPDYAPARSGATHVLDQQMANIQSTADAGDIAAANRQLEVLRRWAPDSLQFSRAQKHLKQARALPPPAPVVMAKNSVADPEQRQRHLSALLSRASAAIAAGHLLTPAGDSAWDALRAARVMAPDDAVVAEALRRFDQAAKECFERQALANRLTDAELCLEARSILQQPAALADARRRLALRWLALGNERIGQNEPELALRALQSARRMDDRAPGLADLERRLATVASVNQR